MRSSCPSAIFAVPKDQMALFLHHLWATDGSVRWDEKGRQGRIYYASTSRRLIDDVAAAAARAWVFCAESCESPSAGYRDCVASEHLSAPRIKGGFFETWARNGLKYFACRQVLPQLGVRRRARPTPTRSQAKSGIRSASLWPVGRCRIVPLPRRLEPTSANRRSGSAARAAREFIAPRRSLRTWKYMI